MWEQEPVRAPLHLFGEALLASAFPPPREGPRHPFEVAEQRPYGFEEGPHFICCGPYEYSFRESFTEEFIADPLLDSLKDNVFGPLLDSLKNNVNALLNSIEPLREHTKGVVVFVEFVERLDTNADLYALRIFVTQVKTETHVINALLMHLDSIARNCGRNCLYAERNCSGVKKML
ncbi:hypothetical protein OROHE_005326 [Orobanche hederae]